MPKFSVYAYSLLPSVYVVEAKNDTEAEAFYLKSGVGIRIYPHREIRHIEPAAEADIELAEAKTELLAIGSPDFPLSDWKREVAGDETRLGYYDWVMSKYPK